MSLPYEAFNDQNEAHFDYGLDLDPAAAAEIFERRLDDRSWLRCPGLMAQRMMALGWRDKLFVRRIVAKVTSEIVKHTVDPLGHEVRAGGR